MSDIPSPMGATLVPLGYSDRRGFAVGMAALSLFSAFPVQARGRFDTAIGGRDLQSLGVPVFSTLQQLLDSPMGQGAQPITVFVGPGRHEGQVVIRRENLHLVGAGPRHSIFSSDAYAGKIAPDGKPYGTFRTAVLEVVAPGFQARDLGIENSFDAPTEMCKPDGLKADEGGSQQAIALALRRGSDRAFLKNCYIDSHQDTLFCEEGRSLFLSCRISGSYDFIFGGGIARFEQCEILSRRRWVPVEGYIAAPSTMIDQPAGLVFDRCTLAAEQEVPTGSVFLARPWRASTRKDGQIVGDLRSVGMAAYLDCTMGSHIAPSGWTRMWYTGAEGNPRTWFEPEEARFSEYRSRGPGAKGLRRGSVLTTAQAALLSRASLLGAWDVPS